MHVTLAPAESHLWLSMVWQPCLSIRGISQQQEGPQLYQHTIQCKVWIEFVTANASGQLVSTVTSLEAIQWGFQQRLVVTPSAEHGRAQICLTNAGLGSTSAIQNRQKTVLQPSRSQPHDKLHRDPRRRMPERHKSIPSSSAQLTPVANKL